MGARQRDDAAGGEGRDGAMAPHISLVWREERKKKNDCAKFGEFAILVVTSAFRKFAN